MLTLRTVPSFRGTMAASSFALKADALLAMSGLPYEREQALPMKQPLGKLPVLVDGETVVPDSTLIQRHLETVRGIDFDGALTPQQTAQGTAIRRLVEDHLYFINGHQRWTLHPDAVKETFFAEVPALIRGLVFKSVNSKRKKAQHGQGLSRHSEADLTSFLNEDVDALATLLGDQPFMLGDNPTSVDATVWGAIHSAWNCDLATPGKAAIGKYANLIAYEERFRTRFYPDA